MEYSNIKQNRKVKTSGVCTLTKKEYESVVESPSYLTLTGESTDHSSSQPSPPSSVHINMLHSHQLPLILFLQKTSIKKQNQSLFLECISEKPLEAPDHKQAVQRSC